MDRTFKAAGQGLQKVFLGEILSVAAVLLYSVAQLLMVVPLMYLGSLVNLAGFVLVLIGLAGATVVRGDYRAALWCAAGNVIASSAYGLVPAGPLQTALGAVSVALDLFVVLRVCRTTADLLVEAGELYIADSGVWAWRLYAGCTVLALGCNLAVVWFYGTLTAALLTLGYVLLRVVGVAVFLAYLFRSQRALRGR